MAEEKKETKRDGNKTQDTHVKELVSTGNNSLS